MKPNDIQDIILHTLMISSCDEYKTNVSHFKSMLDMKMIPKSNEEILHHFEEIYTNLLTSGHYDMQKASLKTRSMYLLLMVATLTQCVLSVEALDILSILAQQRQIKRPLLSGK
jgi:hypothetical protein